MEGSQENYRNPYVNAVPRNFPLRGQTLKFVNCKRIPLPAKNKFVAESRTLLVFFDTLFCFGFHEKKTAKTLYRSK